MVIIHWTGVPNVNKNGNARGRNKKVEIIAEVTNQDDNNERKGNGEEGNGGELVRKFIRRNGEE